jgi:hypothetical protein
LSSIISTKAVKLKTANSDIAEYGKNSRKVSNIGIHISKGSCYFDFISNALIEYERLMVVVMTKHRSNSNRETDSIRAGFA